MTSTTARKAAIKSPKARNTTFVFGEHVPTTSRNQIRTPTLRALVIRRPDLTINVYREFDGMIDGSRIVNIDVTAAWLCTNILDDSLSRTRRIDIVRPLGAATIDISNAVYGVTIRDGEYARRRDLLESLPTHGKHLQTGMTLNNGWPLTVETILHARTGLLEKIEDAMEFDDAIELLRSLTALDELAFYLANQRMLPPILTTTD
jgi:hypothetical protein